MFEPFRTGFDDLIDELRLHHIHTLLDDAEAKLKELRGKNIRRSAAILREYEQGIVTELKSVLKRCSPYHYIDEVIQEFKRFKSYLSDFYALLKWFDLRITDFPTKEKDILLFKSLLKTWIRGYSRQLKMSVIDYSEHLAAVQAFFKIEDRRVYNRIARKIKLLSDQAITKKLRLLSKRDLPKQIAAIKFTYNLNDQYAMKLIHAYSRRKKNSTNYRNLLNDIRKISLNLFLKEMIALLYKYNKKKPVFTPFMVQVTKHISSLDEPAHVIFIEKLNGIADKYDALTYQWKVIIRTIRNSSAMIKKIDKFNGELTVFFKEISSRFAYFKNNLTSREDTEIAERLWEVSFNVARIYFHKVGVTSKPAKDLWSSMLLAALTFKRMINFNVPDKLFNREYNKSLEALDEIHDLLRIEPIGYMDTAKNKAVAPRPVSPFSNTAVISPQN